DRACAAHMRQRSHGQGQRSRHRICHEAAERNYPTNAKPQQSASLNETFIKAPVTAARHFAKHKSKRVSFL
ncbi:MAG: hypothetical protein AB9M53_07205, partial [Leptothrix sp. (in: b-proteobacteria)]